MLPPSLLAAIEEQAGKLPLSELRRDAQAISERYRSESGRGERLLTRDKEAQAYALVRMPATFGAAQAALAWTLERTELRPQSLIDAGAGTGAASWAADSLLELKRVTCLEREPAMSTLGRMLMCQGSETLREAEWIPCDLVRDVISDKAEMVISAYVTNEMTPEGRAATAEKLWNAAEKLLVIIEPGTPKGWQQLLQIRTLLLQRGAHLLTPCPHEKDCPLPEGDWCQFTARIQRSRMHRLLKGGDAPYEDENFIYMAFTREETALSEGRILRHPSVQKGQIDLHLCTAAGIRDVTVRKRDAELFRVARKAANGDSFPVEPRKQQT